jgi:hypothetical protein
MLNDDPVTNTGLKNIRETFLLVRLRKVVTCKPTTTDKLKHTNEETAAAVVEVMYHMMQSLIEISECVRNDIRHLSNIPFFKKNKMAFNVFFSGNYFITWRNFSTFHFENRQTSLLQHVHVYCNHYSGKSYLRQA